MIALLVSTFAATAATFDMPITIYMEEPPSITNLTKDDVLLATIDSINEWQVDGSSVEIMTEFDPTATISIKVVWDITAEQADGVWGFSSIYIYEEQPETIIFSTIRMVSDRSWTDDNSLDFHSVLIHEIGHSIGFQHSTEPESTMYYMASSGETNKRDLTNADKQMVREAYPYVPVINEQKEEENKGCSSSFLSFMFLPVMLRKRYIK
jgi:predicted Zn-dependent protease